MAAVVKPNPSFLPTLCQMIDKRMGMAVRTLREVAKDKIGQSYPPAAQPFDPPHRRSGGLQRAVFAERVSQMNWVFGVRVVAPDPDRPTNNRERLGLWRELGTGRFRRITGGASTGGGGSVVRLSKRPSEIIRTSTYPNPFLIPTLMNDGPRVVSFYLKN